MQESPVMPQFVMVDLRPRFNQALLRARQSTSDALDRIKGEHRVEFLVGRVEVRPMMWRPDFWKHPDDDPKES